MRVLARLVVVFVLLAPGGAARADLITVTSLDDAGSGTLRAAITAANANTNADVIELAVSGTIQLAPSYRRSHTCSPSRVRARAN